MMLGALTILWQSRGLTPPVLPCPDPLCASRASRIQCVRTALCSPKPAKDRLMHTLDDLDAQSLRSDVPDFRAGDTLKVHVRVVEGNRSRVQIFQGVVIR